MRHSHQRVSPPGTVTLAVALLLSAVTVAGQDTTDSNGGAAMAATSLTLELVAELAVGADNQVIVLGRRLQDQVDDLGISGYLDDISVRFSGSVGGDAGTPPAGSGSAVLSAGIEIIPQLTVSGSLAATGSAAGSQGSADPLTGSVGLSFNPFADPTGRDRAELAAESTAADLADARARAAYRAIGSLIDAVSARMELELLTIGQEIAVRSLADVLALHERERATDQQLASAEEIVRVGARRIVRAELSRDRDREALAREIGVAAESIEIPPADELDLESHISAAADLLESMSAAELAEGDVAVLHAAQNLRSAQLDLKSAHRFTPRLSITASGGLPNWQYSVGAELTISPADWDGAAVQSAESDLAFAVGEYEYALRIAEYDALSALGELQFSMDDLDVTRGDLADTRRDLAEAEFRFGRGDIPQLALDQTGLAVTEAEHEVFAAMLNVARRLGAIEFGQY